MGSASADAAAGRRAPADAAAGRPSACGPQRRWQGKDKVAARSPQRAA